MSYKSYSLLQGELVQEEPLAAAKLHMVSRGKVLPLDQAIHLSIDCACKSLRHFSDVLFEGFHSSP